MIIEPRVRGFICITAHPEGCRQNVLQQIAYTKSKGSIEGPKRVLVIGASTGFGLASRITAGFGLHASTVGVYFEKPPAVGKTASPGWYNTAAFEQQAQAEGLYAKSINGDAFSDKIKQQTAELIKKDLGQVDLVIYSLASPVRTHPHDHITYRSVLKPIGSAYKNKTVDFHNGKVSDIMIDSANEEEISNTVTVMGGEDWLMWMDVLQQEGLLARNALTVAYSYIGPSVTEAIYRKGTIGRAKDNLEATAEMINARLKNINGQAYVSVNKALVTQASSAIPVIPLYISLLFKIMKEKNIHEGCIEQIQRLYKDRLYTADNTIPVDKEGRIRIDELEMRADVQEEVAALWPQASTETLPFIGDMEGYNNEFFRLFGFKIPGVNYQADTNEMVAIPGLSN